MQQGGNAVLGTDIDYSEAGAGKGMLMVCMAGTAVKITNLNELNYNIEALEEIKNTCKNLPSRLNRYSEVSDRLLPLQNDSSNNFVKFVQVGNHEHICST